jgi:hypothetical protein
VPGKQNRWRWTIHPKTPGNIAAKEGDLKGAEDGR